jgi:hypothetical protein
MTAEVPMLVISANDRIISRPVVAEAEDTSHQWAISSPIPGYRIINTWQIYNKIWAVLARAEGGNYNIFRSLDLHRYTLVHSHASEIYDIYYIDDGHAIFCAADGWWATTDAGVTWDEVEELTTLPTGALAVVQLEEHLWALVAYGWDRKIYYAEYPGGDFAEVYDATGVLGKWHPAISGGPVGVLAGAGDKLLRSDDAGENFYVVQTVEGTVKSVVVSNQSNQPVFLITVEPAAGDTDKLYWTYDLGDSLVQDLSRVGPVSSVQSVTPTGSGEPQTMFAVMGRRAAGQAASCKILTPGA